MSKEKINREKMYFNHSKPEFVKMEGSPKFYRKCCGNEGGNKRILQQESLGLHSEEKPFCPKHWQRQKIFYPRCLFVNCVGDFTNPCH